MDGWVDEWSLDGGGCRKGGARAVAQIQWGVMILEQIVGGMDRGPLSDS